MANGDLQSGAQRFFSTLFTGLGDVARSAPAFVRQHRQDEQQNRLQDLSSVLNVANFQQRASEFDERRRQFDESILQGAISRDFTAGQADKDRKFRSGQADQNFKRQKELIALEGKERRKLNIGNILAFRGLAGQEFNRKISKFDTEIETLLADRQLSADDEERVAQIDRRLAEIGKERDSINIGDVFMEVVEGSGFSRESLREAGFGNMVDALEKGGTAAPGKEAPAGSPIGEERAIPENQKKFSLEIEALVAGGTTKFNRKAFLDYAKETYGLSEKEALMVAQFEGIELLSNRPPGRGFEARS